MLTSKTWGQTQRQICQSAHEECRNQRNRGGSRDVIPTKFVFTDIIRIVDRTNGVIGRAFADAWSARIRKDRSVYADDLVFMSAVSR